jgi:hypothetical protein
MILKKYLLLLLLFTLTLKLAYSKDEKPKFELESVICPKEIVIHMTMNGTTKFKIAINYKYLGPLIETKKLTNDMDSCGFSYLDTLFCEYNKIYLFNKKFLQGYKEELGFVSGEAGNNVKFELENGKIYKIDLELEINFSRIKEKLKNAFFERKVESIFLKLCKFERKWEVFDGKMNLPEFKKFKFKLKINKIFKINIRYED